MAYARFRASGSEVYVYQDAHDLCCELCDLNNQTVWKTNSRRRMIEHLEALCCAGNTVPESAIEELTKEINDSGDLV